MIKKVTAIFAAIAVALSLTACSNTVKRHKEGEWTVLESGTFEHGKLSGSGRLMKNAGKSYCFCEGEFVDGVFSGNGYKETYVGGAVCKTDYWIGTFLDGDFVEGESIGKEKYGSGSVFVLVGSFVQGNNYSLYDGYEMKFDADGILVLLSKYTNGEKEELSPEQISKISELQKYNAEYIDEITSTHYGYNDSFNEMKTALGN